jgi:hypothetical protein
VHSAGDFVDLRPIGGRVDNVGLARGEGESPAAIASAASSESSYRPPA